MTKKDKKTETKKPVSSKEQQKKSDKEAVEKLLKKNAHKEFRKVLLNGGTLLIAPKGDDEKLLFRANKVNTIEVLNPLLQAIKIVFNEQKSDDTKKLLKLKILEILN